MRASAARFGELAVSVSGGESNRVCPFLDHNDPRCSDRFNLHQLACVFGECLGVYEGCEVFHQITIELRVPGRVPLAASA